MTFRQYWPALLIAAIFFMLGLLRLNDLSIYTDSTRYVIWGNSVAHLKGFVDDTQPIPSRFVMNAPLYPVLLAPVELAWPLSLTATKLWTLLWATAALILLYAWFLRYFRRTPASLAVLLLALNPLFFTLSTEVLSEAPFIALGAILLIAMDGYRENPGDRRTRLILFAGLAVIPLLREVGAAYVLASLILIFRLKHGKDLLILCLSAGGLFLLWTLRNTVFVGGGHNEQVSNVQYLFGHFVTAPSSSLASELTTRIWLNLKSYILQVSGQILFPFPEGLIVGSGPLYRFLHQAASTLRIPLAVVLVAAMFPGVRSDVRSSPSGLWRMLVLGFYGVIVLVYPVHDVRFLLPLLPLVFFYSIKGAESAMQTMRSTSLRLSIAAAVLAFLLLPNAVAIAELIRTNIEYRNDPEGFASHAREAGESAMYYDRPWSALGIWIGQNIPEGVTIASPAKEAVPYIGKRLMLETSRVLPTPVFERTMRDFNASYLITTRMFDSVQTFDAGRIESRRLRFEPLHSVAGITLYGIHSAIGREVRDSPTSPPDTSSVSGLLLRGHLALQNLRYQEALDLFRRALQREPSQPEIAYQLMTTLAILGDSTGATEMNKHLFTLPQSTAYSQPAQAHLGAMTQLLKARQPALPVNQAFTAFEAGLAYWGLGYPRVAYRIMGNVVKLDPTNFVGNLWATYMAQELGDTAASNRFLANLTAIDRDASIVRDWTSIRSSQNALPAARSPRERSAIHRRIAALYSKIGLFDNSLDELERALLELPEDVDTWLAEAEVFERKGAPIGARNAYEHVLKLEPRNPFAAARLDSLAN